MKNPSADARYAILPNIAARVGYRHAKTGTLFFNPKLKQRLQLRQPKFEALQFLIERGDRVHLNRVEIALDWIFEERDQCNGAHKFLSRYHVKSHHYKQGIRFVGDADQGINTRYSGPRTARNLLVLYSDKVCKSTGELDTTHSEWRIRSPDALKRVGISSVKDLLKIDPHEFWNKRLICKAWDLRTLGHQYRKFYHGVKRNRHQIIKRNSFRYDVDARQGAAMMPVLQSTQQILDDYQTKFKSKISANIDIRRLLPVEWESTGMGVFQMSKSTAPHCDPRVIPMHCSNGDIIISHKHIEQHRHSEQKFSRHS